MFSVNRGAVGKLAFEATPPVPPHIQGNMLLPRGVRQDMQLSLKLAQTIRGFSFGASLGGIPVPLHQSAGSRFFPVVCGSG